MTDHHHPTHAASGTEEERASAYAEAYASAQPDPGRRVVAVDLEAREIGWEFVPGITTRAWGFNGTVPGCRHSAWRTSTSFGERSGSRGLQ